MKLNYFNYQVAERSGLIYSFDMNDFFSAFVDIDNPAWKNQFSVFGENIYLFRLPSARNYMFLKTARNEFIHKIDKNNLGHKEIAEELQRDESLGFASYIYVGDKFLGIGSTFSAPRHSAFAKFVNDIFQKISLRDYQFSLKPLERVASRSEVMQMQHVGRMSLSVDTSNGFAQSIAGLLNADAGELDTIEGVEVIIKPKRQTDIKSTANKVFDVVGDVGVEKLVVRAKQEMTDKLADIYVEGRGVLYDFIESRDHGHIPFEITDKVTHNASLPEKLHEVLSNETIRQEDIEQVSVFDDVGHWGRFMDDL
ncbi:MAG: hypothetical protein DSZ27_07380 [Thiomicrospira sp.]|nr:MAG: hypothetical protein DSZ27_07380 [Thiomicrospira sp.]